MPDETQAQTLAALARELNDENDVESVLRRTVAAAAAEVPGAEYAGITVVTRRELATPVASDDLVLKVDQGQYETGQGPCLEAAVEREFVVRVDDLASDERYPAFGQHAVQLGIHSMLSFYLFTQAGTIGALNLYASEPRAFDQAAEDIGALLAAHAAVAVASTRKEANLVAALSNRDVIGQAKGILMERYKINADRAFDLLVAASQRTHRKLTDVAGQLAETGELAGS
ncbi:MAG: GAF and ANTAR domain-containing protein [Actinobacteria bacterium]|nr:GAF and ANTAR domain-containing protein [Actinomycetota bacterium]